MPAQREKNEPFIVITCEEEDVRQTRPADSKDPMYQQWVDHGAQLAHRCTLLSLTRSPAMKAPPSLKTP